MTGQSVLLLQEALPHLLRDRSHLLEMAVTRYQAKNSYNTLDHDLAEERHLYSVRCLKVYLPRTKTFRERKRLFCIYLQKNKSFDTVKTPSLVGLGLSSTLSTLMPTKVRLHLWVDPLIPFVPWQLLLPLLAR